LEAAGLRAGAAFLPAFFGARDLVDLAIALHWTATHERIGTGHRGRLTILGQN
jgi:hypothetical protein